MRAGWLGTGLLAVGMVWVLGALGQAMAPMARDAKPGFEVAAIKLSIPGDQRQGINTDGHRMTLERQTVKSMVMFAYGIHGKQIVGQPDWVDAQEYDVKGVLDVEGEPDLKQMQGALQKLLAARFGLKTHAESREMSYFALRVAGTPKLVAAAAPEAQPDQTGNGGAAGMSMQFTSNTMDDFTLGLQYFAERPVVNETGLNGRWDFALRWAPDDLKVVDANGAPGLFTALKEQLGLKLEATKGPVKVMVVDGVAQPSEN